MSFLNNIPDHFIMLYAISRGMKSEKKEGFFGVKKERNND